MAEKVQVNADKLKVLNAVMEKIEKDFELGDSEGAAITPYERILAVLERSDIRSDAAYVYSFFKVISKLFRTS